ncbi:MAG: Gfo/Idh/MocA family oxidoreductase, partial [Anaerolineaceae bacterium]
MALLGTGVIAAPHALALRSTPGVEIVAVCDREQNKASQFQQTWGIPQAYDSIDDLFAGSRPDVVHVLLPPAAH